MFEKITYSRHTKPCEKTLIFFMRSNVCQHDRYSSALFPDEVSADYDDDSSSSYCPETCSSEDELSSEDESECDFDNCKIVKCKVSIFGD